MTDTASKAHASNELRLAQKAKTQPLVTGDEKIAVFGAGGQIGTKLKPLLEKLYPGKVIYCDAPQFAAKKGMTPLDVTDDAAIRGFIKQNKVKAIINLAALLSAAADEHPDVAFQINSVVPLTLMKTSKDMGVRSLMMMSSMAAQEHDPRYLDTEEVKEMRDKLHGDASTTLISVPNSAYGLSKLAMEANARQFNNMKDSQLNVVIPRLAGVLNAHTPWPSNGTTEELDKLVVAAAVHKVYGDQWEAKMQELLQQYHPEAVKNGHYMKNGKYVPEVPADTAFDMVDGKTLPEAVLLLMHENLQSQHDIGEPGPVHNVSEYSVSMGDAARILGKLDEGFPVEFATKEKDGWDMDKVTRAKMWPAKQNTATTENLIGNFKERGAEKSIKAAFDNAVAALREQRTQEMQTRVARRSPDTELGS